MAHLRAFNPSWSGFDHSGRYRTDNSFDEPSLLSWVLLAAKGVDPGARLLSSISLGNRPSGFDIGDSVFKMLEERHGSTCYGLSR